MGVLKEEIEQFLDTKDLTESEYGCGYGRGSGDGYGRGSGSGDGCGCEYGDGCGYGRGSGSGDGDGCGCGRGYGRCRNVKAIHGHAVYSVDGVPTVFTAIRGDFAQGFILQDSLQLRPCYIARGRGRFAHGDTLRQAWEDLQEKMLEDSPADVRIAEFVNAHPDRNRAYPAADLFLWHHILTGSCSAGREAFCIDRGICVEKDSFTIRQFIELTENAYGGEIVKLLEGRYAECKNGNSKIEAEV